MESLSALRQWQTPGYNRGKVSERLGRRSVDPRGRNGRRKGTLFLILPPASSVGGSTPNQGKTHHELRSVAQPGAMRAGSTAVHFHQPA